MSDRHCLALFDLGLLGIFAADGEAGQPRCFLPRGLGRPGRAMGADLEPARTPLQKILIDIGDQALRRHADAETDQLVVPNEAIHVARLEIADHPLRNSNIGLCHDTTSTVCPTDAPSIWKKFGRMRAKVAG